MYRYNRIISSDGTCRRREMNVQIRAQRMVSCRALSERARGKFKRADACALHAYTNGGEKRTLCTCAHFLAHANVHECARPRIALSFCQWGPTTLASWPWAPVDYISARALRFSYFPYIFAFMGFLCAMENVLSTSVRQKDWIKKALKGHCSWISH